LAGQRFVPSVVAALAAVVIAAMASACGSGDGELSLPEYFDRVQAIREVDEGRFAPLADDFATAVDPKKAAQERIEALRSALDGAAAANRAAASDYDALDPPSEAEEAHADLVDAISEAADRLDDVSARSQEVASQSDLDALLAELEEPELVKAFDRPGRVCAELQTVADENEVEIELGCGD
jgi:hypothetical protein